MLKKTVLALALMAGLSVGALRAQFSVGGGFIMDLSWVQAQSEMSGFGVFNYNVFAGGFGGHVFASWRFAEFQAGLLSGPLVETFSTDVFDQGRFESSFPGSFSAADLSLLGRFPFDLGALALSPLLGAGGQLVFSAPQNTAGSVWGLSNIRIMLGAGVDIPIVQNIFFRGSLLGYYRFPNTWDNFPEGAGGFGLQARLAAGFRLARR